MGQVGTVALSGVAALVVAVVAGKNTAPDEHFVQVKEGVAKAVGRMVALVRCCLLGYLARQHRTWEFPDPAVGRVDWAFVDGVVPFSS